MTSNISVSWSEITSALDCMVVDNMNKFNYYLDLLDKSLNHNYPEDYEEYREWAVDQAYKVIKVYELLSSLRMYLGYRSAFKNRFSLDMQKLRDFIREYGNKKMYCPDSITIYKLRQNQEAS